MINGDFINNVFLKTPLQHYIYSIIEKYKINGNSIIVSGPDIIRHIFDARTTFAKRQEQYINIVEIDNDVFECQKNIIDNLKISNGPVPLWMSEDKNGKPLEVLPIDHNVNIIHDNIINIDPEHVIDADLMSTIKKSGDILIKIFNDQLTKYQYDNKLKAYIFTMSLRSCSEEETLSWLRNQMLIRIGCDLGFKTNLSGYLKENLTKNIRTRKSTNNTKNNNIKMYKDYIIYRKGRLIDFIMFSYIDSKGPMITGLIIYN